MAANPSSSNPAGQESVESLQEMHRSLQDRLNELDKHRSLSAEERFEVQVIKKRKLALKDRIQQLEKPG